MLFQGLGLDEPFETRLEKESGVHSSASNGNKQATTEVHEVGEVMGTIVMNPIMPHQDVGDSSRPSTGLSLQGIG